MTKVRLYLMTRQRLIQLQRSIAFQRVPCVGEWLQFKFSGLLPCQITEVTHNERGNTEVVIGAQTDEAGKVAFHASAKDLQADVDGLLKGGWKVVSDRPNRYWGKRAGKRLQRSTVVASKRRG